MDRLAQIAAKLTPAELDDLRKLGVRYDPANKKIVGSHALELLTRENEWHRYSKDPELFVIDSGLVKTLDNQKKFNCLRCEAIVKDFAGLACPKCEGPMALRDPVQPFPKHRYGPRFLLRLLQVERKLCVAKSRRLMATELFCAYSLWLMLFRKGALVVFQSDAEDKANDNVRRVYGMWSRLPLWMRKRRPCNPTKGGDQIESYFEIPVNLSRLKAIPSGPEKIREMGPSFYFCDEAAFHTNAIGTYKAVTQAIEAGCQSAYVSTAAAGFFAGLYNDCLEDVG